MKGFVIAIPQPTNLEEGEYTLSSLLAMTSKLFSNLSTDIGARGKCSYTILSGSGSADSI